MDGLGWYRSPGAATAHAFASGPGWTRSLCLGLTWTVRLVRAGGRGRTPRAMFEEPSLCRECCAAIDARRPGGVSVTESEARVLDGNR